MYLWGKLMTLLETLEYFLTETAADMDGLSWEIREETNFEDNNIEHLTECYDFNKELYDNLKQIKSIIENIETLKWADKILDGVDLNEELPDEETT
jgi:hypothetical protein